MKKLVLSIAIVTFVAFGTLGVQHIIASATNTEIVNLDKDPKKGDTKKEADAKDVKADTKITESADKSSSSSCASSCSDKSASAKACCSSEKAGCCGTPDKK